MLGSMGSSYSRLAQRKSIVVLRALPGGLNETESDSFPILKRLNKPDSGLAGAVIHALV
jgi:hypothetical protein